MSRSGPSVKPATEAEGPLKATGSQRPYDQGVAEAMAMMNALLGKTTPAWVGVQSLPVVQSNVLESFKTVFKKIRRPSFSAHATTRSRPATDANQRAGGWPRLAPGSHASRPFLPPP